MVGEEDLLLLVSYKVTFIAGVLHHLRDPTTALAMIASLLKEDGGMQLMVYAW